MKFLDRINIKIVATKLDLKNMNNKNLFNVIFSLLQKIKDIVEKNIVPFEGTKNFKQFAVSKIFCDKRIKTHINSERGNGDEQYLRDKDWYAFESNFGTSEEKACVRLMERIIEEDLKENFKNIYLLRNELYFKIFDFDNGDAFAPDFVLFLESENKKDFVYQIFIEPKAPFIEETDK